MNTVTVTTEVDVPVADWMGVTGPAVVVLSKFKRYVYKSSAIKHLDLLHASLKMVGLKPGDGKSRPMPEEDLALIRENLPHYGDTEELMALVQELYTNGNIHLSKRPFVMGGPKETPDGRFTRRAAVIRRMHTLFYNPDQHAFTVPQVTVGGFGCPFYLTSDRVHFSARHAAKHGPELQALFKWSKKTWKSLYAIERAFGDAVLTKPVCLGSPEFYPTSTSKLSKEYVETRALERLRRGALDAGEAVPLSMSEVQRTSPEVYNIAINEVYMGLVGSGEPLPQEAYSEVSDERYAGFSVDPGFKPCVLGGSAGILPELKLFSSLPEGTQDLFVFNGEPLPV